MSDFDPLAPETFDSFHEEFAELRQRCPVAHSDGLQRLLGADALRRRRRGGERSRRRSRPRCRTSCRSSRSPAVGRRSISTRPSTRRTGRRSTRTSPPRRWRCLEPRLREIIGGLLAGRSSTRARSTSARTYTYRLPGYVFAEFFNLTPELGLRIRDASREFNLAVQDFVDEDVKRTSLQLYDIAREIIAMRKAEPLDPADDPATGLLATGLPEDMLLGTIRQFIVVGMIAPSVFIGSMVIHLAEHEDAAAAAARRPVPHPRRGRGVPPPADAVPRLRADADARRRDPRAADPQGRAGRGRVRVGEPRRGRLPRPRPLHPRPARTSAATSPSASARTAAPARRSAG